MADNDYICVYRQFFEEFAKSYELEDQRPMRLNIYNLLMDELIGEVMQSCVNFLTERQCPNCLVVPLTRIVVEELLSEAKKQPEEVDTPLKLNKKTHQKIWEVCLRYTDNEKLSSLPAPAPETHHSTHSTKHTRRRMEDRYICLPRFNTLHGIQSNSEAEYYGIFDGHAGVTAASFAVSHLHQFLAESKFYPDDPVQAFREAYAKTETRFNSKQQDCGTASIAILYQPTEKKLIVSWVGDSQALLVTEDSYVMLVDPHKPERPDERKRIESLGGFVLEVQNSFRVNGELAISRAIGDRKLKPCVSAEPEFRVLNLTGSEHFVVMGCDGLWDVVEPEQVIETVYFELKSKGGQVDTVARRLVDLAKENNSTDNITVVVFFLTDPSEINNRSIDVTGHRPKIIDQNGLIMEANYQSNDSALNGIYETSNGNYHRLRHNSSHGYEDQMRNESDEDLGPETDVDAADDLLVSPKANSNPFAGGNDCWQQKVPQFTENSGQFIEYTEKCGGIKGDLEDAMGKESGDEFGGSTVGQDEIQAKDEIFLRGKEIANAKFANNDSDAEDCDDGDIHGVAHEKYKMDPSEMVDSFGEGNEERHHHWREEIQSKELSLDYQNPFQGSVINNYAEALNVVNNGSDDNKFANEIGRSETDKSGMNSRDVDPYESESPLPAVESEKSAKEIFGMMESEPRGEEIGRMKGFEEVEDFIRRETPADDFSPPEKFQPSVDDASQETKGEEAVDVVATSDKPEMDVFAKDSPADKNAHEDVFGEDANLLDVVKNDESRRDISNGAFEGFEKNDDEIFDGKEPGSDMFNKSFSAVADVDVGNPPPPKFHEGSDDLEEPEEKPFNRFSPAEEVAVAKAEENAGGNLLMPSSPHEDGEIKDEIVGESGGEVEDSEEDDEWNYIKVGSDVPVGEDKPSSDLVSSEVEVENKNNKGITTTGGTMNSPLNPDAAEFIPVSPVSQGEEDFPTTMETPIKNIPQDLAEDDIVASSPNWQNMADFVLPEESAFLKEIKSRPNNVLEELQYSSQKIDFDSLGGEKNNGKECFENLSPTLNEPDAEPEMNSSPEPRGLDLAKDMTGSFIDPSTMSSGDDLGQRIIDTSLPEIKEPVAEDRLLQATPAENDIVVDHAKVASEFSDFVSPVPAKEHFSPIPMLTPATPRSTAVEVSSSPESEASTLPIADIQEPLAVDANLSASEPTKQDMLSSSFDLIKPIESSVEETKKDAAVAAAAATAVAAAAGVVAASATAAAAAKEKRATPKPGLGKTGKPTATKPPVSDIKTSAATKKPLAGPKTTAAAKPGTGVPMSPTKTAPARVSSVSKTTTKSPSSVTSSANKVPPARPKSAAPAASTLTKTPPSKTTATLTSKSGVVGAPKPAVRSTPSTLAAKPKPRLPSAPLEKKATPNGDIKTTAKRTEITKKPLGTSTLTTTRVTLSARPATAPAKTAASRTTVTTTRTVTAKPRTSPSSTTTTTSTVTNSGRLSSVTKKTTTITTTSSSSSSTGMEKHAKEMANRLTSKTVGSGTAKMNGVAGPGRTSGTTLTKNRKLITTTTTTTTTGNSPSKTKPVSKTEIKADKIVEKTIDIIESEKEKPLMENNMNVNILSSLASE